MALARVIKQGAFVSAEQEQEACQVGAECCGVVGAVATTIERMFERSSACRRQAAVEKGKGAMVHVMGICWARKSWAPSGRAIS